VARRERANHGDRLPGAAATAFRMAASRWRSAGDGSVRGMADHQPKVTRPADASVSTGTLACSTQLLHSSPLSRAAWRWSKFPSAVGPSGSDPGRRRARSSRPMAVRPRSLGITEPWTLPPSESRQAPARSRERIETDQVGVVASGEGTALQVSLPSVPARDGSRAASRQDGVRLEAVSSLGMTRASAASDDARRSVGCEQSASRFGTSSSA